MEKRQQNQLKKNIRGQGMVEYIIIVALIAVAAIAAFSFFGKTVRNQVSALATEVGGTESKEQIDAAKASAADAAKVANQDYNLGNFDEGANKGAGGTGGTN